MNELKQKYEDFLKLVVEASSMPPGEERDALFARRSILFENIKTLRERYPSINEEVISLIKKILEKDRQLISNLIKEKEDLYQSLQRCLSLRKAQKSYKALSHPHSTYFKKM